MFLRNKGGTNEGRRVASCVFSGGEGMLQATKELGIGRHWLMAARPTPPSGMLREGCYAKAASANVAGTAWHRALLRPTQPMTA